jgi:hypothetical protein
MQASCMPRVGSFIGQPSEEADTGLVSMGRIRRLPSVESTGPPLQDTVGVPCGDPRR